MAIIIWFINSNWQIQQCILHFQLIVQSMLGEQVARELMNFSALLAAMRNPPSVNNVAIHNIKIVYPSLLDVGCFSNTLHV